MKKESFLICIVFAGIFLFLQYFNAYHFTYIEQTRLFLFTSDYLKELAVRPGGLCEYISEFLIQFFFLPYCGTLIVSTLLTGIFAFTYFLLKRKGLPLTYFIFAFFPCFFLLFCHFDYFYFIQGTVAYFCCVLALFLLTGVKDSGFRFGVVLLSGCCLFWVAGSIAVLFGVAYSIYEWTKNPDRKRLFYAIGVLISILGTAGWSTRFLFQGEFRLGFLPDLYYHLKMKPEKLIYFSWISFILVLLIVTYIKKWYFIGKKSGLALVIIQTAMIVAGFFLCLNVYGYRSSYPIKKMDYFSRKGEWDQIIEEMKRRPARNFLYNNYLNLALAQRGELTKRMFEFDQGGMAGLLVNWNKNWEISFLLSDVCFYTGNIVSSRRYAFEANVTLDNRSGRALQRLIQTELIYGNYKIAEKYICILEHTLFYSSWAKEQRRFLYNDEACNADAVIGYKRKWLIAAEKNQLVPDFFDELVRLTDNFPQNKEATEYLIASWLLSKDINSLASFIQSYPDQNPSNIYQQALLAFYETHPEEWSKYGITENTIQLYSDYKTLWGKNSSRSNLKNIMQSRYGHTYWFYLQFK